MEYTKIHGLDQKASRVGLGTWAIGGWMWGGTDEAQSVRTIHAALDKGINLVDTAPVYGFGTSEQIVGKAVAEYGQRDRLILATKVALQWDDAQKKVWRNSSPERIRKEIEDSLRRLQTDYIDIYQIHWPDPVVPFDKTAEVMAKLVDEGKIRAIGVSNYTVEQMEAFRAAAPLAVCQPPYNVFERAIENDILPYCIQSGIATLTYGALCRGLLSGKMTADQQFDGDDLRKVDPKFKSPRFAQYLEAVKQLQNLAEKKYSKKVLHLAVRYVLDKGASVALWGGRRPEQMEPLPDIFGWQLAEEDFAEMDQILAQAISDPVGPEFMAPPARQSE
ncbi:aryl-alcohol dehydrogenase-like predicted oxidoreductase [Desulfosalsimonas propionicica]|uniref:Aryl-alcohol dehydrogenase-like predicted oxidoreductase n=1 Tax=Desulfosalsimonas propionicica TaxID=332175 RepID=A0A7W0C885_9BACT|nr:aldo/keto reductase [Desulfosalsimonas propionicica]MBA2880966.1 aryl-alcohol dehydrogenase-like predicted oxidoreductase [Desulfosalsimonas propionicica]